MNPFLEAAFPTRAPKIAAEQFIYNSVWRRCFIEGGFAGEIIACAAGGIDTVVGVTPAPSVKGNWSGEIKRAE
jgi:hypothetical protein